MNNLDPLVSTGPSQSHSPRLNRRDTINVRKLGIVSNSSTNINSANHTFCCKLAQNSSWKLNHLTERF